MKGIILAGGSGTRLHPITLETSKQLLPIYDKPMIYYPLATLMDIGLSEILIISTPHDLPRIERLLKDGSSLGIKLSYKVQDNPNGIAESFILAEDFIGDDSVCLILGDNIFSGPDFKNYGQLKNITNLTDGALILAYHVNDPERYGVAEFDENNKVLSIVEKPKEPKSSWAVTGLYFYDNQVVEIAKNLKPSARGELEITDVNNIYLKQGKLNVDLLRRGFAWLDTGTPDSLLDAANYVHTIQKRQGRNLACIEEIAYQRGFINKEALTKLANNIKIGNAYGDYLKKIAND